MPSWALPSGFLEKWYREVKMFTQAPLQQLKAMATHPEKRDNKDARVEALGERREHCESRRYAGMRCIISYWFKALLLALGGFFRPSWVASFSCFTGFPNSINWQMCASILNAFPLGVGDNFSETSNQSREGIAVQQFFQFPCWAAPFYK